MSVRVIKPFKAIRLINELSCMELDESDLDGDVPFNVGGPVLNDGFAQANQFVNGEPVVQFTCGLSSYCVRRSIFETHTEPIRRKDEGTSSL